MQYETINDVPSRYREQARMKMEQREKKSKPKQTEMKIEASEKKPRLKGHIIIPGTPTAKSRPKFNAHTHKAYTPEATKKKEKAIEKAWKNKYGDQMLSGTLRMKVFAAFDPPKSMSKKKRNYLIDNSIYHAKKPDLDNIYKLCCDALNGIAYADDSAIAYIIGGKFYADEPFTFIEIEEIPDRGKYITEYIEGLRNAENE